MVQTVAAAAAAQEDGCAAAAEAALEGCKQLPEQSLGKGRKERVAEVGVPHMSVTAMVCCVDTGLRKSL